MEIIIKSIIRWIGFILWFIYLGIELFKEINQKNMQKNYPKYIKKNILNVLRLDKLILIIVFIIYTTFHNKTVNIYLFAIIMLYLLVNLLYEKEKIKINLKKEWKYYLSFILISIIPIIFYLVTKKITITHFIMLGILYLFQIIFMFLTMIFEKN